MCSRLWLCHSDDCGVHITDFLHHLLILCLLPPVQITYTSSSSPIFQGYAPQIFYPKRTSKHIYEILVTQCEKLKIPFLGSLPAQTEIDTNYDVILDAIFGFSFKGALRAPFDDILSKLRSCRTPICSIDVPSGEI